MARARSPEYPAISLKEAIERVEMVWKKDYQNHVPRKVVAEHMGYSGLSGASLPVLSSLIKYGLLEGRGDETHVSDLAVAILAHPPGSTDRIEALKQAAICPALFAEFDARFPTGASDRAIRAYLLTNKFIPSAADAAIRAYRDTKALVEAESAGYHSGEAEQEATAVTPQIQTPAKPGTLPPAPSVPLRVVMNGNRLDIQASVDLEGLKKLQEMLGKYQAILEMADEIPPMGNMEKVGGVWKPRGQ